MHQRARRRWVAALMDGPALWRARVSNGKVAEWRVYDDSAENRGRLGLG